VWLARGIRHQTIKTVKYQFVGNREEVRSQAAKAALEGLLETLNQKN
jgi:nicotinamide mononucleotide (NMN) deamidase PncC